MKRKRDSQSRWRENKPMQACARFPPNQSVFRSARHFFKAFFGFPDSVMDGSVSKMHKSNLIMTMMQSFLSSSTMSGLRFFAVTVALLISATAVAGEQRSSLAFQSCTHNPSRLGCIQEHRPSAFTGPSYHPRSAASLTPTAGARSSSTSRFMLTEVLSEVSTWISDTAAAVPVSPEPIHTAFTVATFLPQPFWLLIILLPNTGITKKVMGGLGT
jgi:hypothetical protein